MSSTDSTSTRHPSSGSDLGSPSGAGSITGVTECVLRDHSPMDVSSPAQLLSISPTNPSSSSQSTLSRAEDENISTPRDQTLPSAGPRPQDADNAARGETGNTRMARMEELWYGTTHVTRSWWQVQRERRIGRRQSSSVAHDDARQSTRKKVEQAVAACLGRATDVAHEALHLGVNLPGLAPFPGLSTAAKTLLAIWDAVDKVDLNGISCLRLTERCADILISVREEISRMGDEVGIELSVPIAKLEESFAQVADTMNKQAKRPFLKRYLKRDEIFLEINHCDSLLKDAMALFNSKIQLKILSLVQESNNRQNVDQQEIRELMSAIANGHIPVAAQTRATILSNTAQEATPSSVTTEVQQSESLLLSTEAVVVEDAPGVSANSDHRPEIPHTSILQTLHHIYLDQNSVDAALDLLQLRKIMRDALQATSDTEMLLVLQIEESEMLDAIRTLRRALDASISAVQSHPSISSDSSVMTESVVDVSAQQRPPVPRSRDTLDDEFMETGIVALQRLSDRHITPSAPGWSITKYEIVRNEIIGVGAYSWVYRGKWDGKTVAIKVLKDFLTPREVFIKEVEIWNTFKHPNILLLFGASSTQGGPPWFFVSPYMQHGSLLDHLQKVERDRRPSGLGLEPVIHSASPFHLHVPERADSVPIPPRRGSNAGREHTLPSTSAHTASNIVEREWDLVRFMHHIAKGMEYLHSRNPPVLHGDLKAANVLVDSRFCALVADFGQSELRTGWPCRAMSGGTLRWQAPEIWGGAGPLTPAVDVWAFSITCAEILNMGRMPWRNVDDAVIQVLVREHNSRPDIPPTSRFNIHDLRVILFSCWQMDAGSRPSFAKISHNLKLLRRVLGRGLAESPQAAPMELAVTQIDRAPSPSLAPIRIPSFLQNTAVTVVEDVLSGGNDTTQFTRTSVDSPCPDLTIPTAVVQAPTPGFSTAISRRSTLESPLTSARFDKVEFEQHHISPQEDELTSFRNALKYRLNLRHDFYPLEMLPLWDPSPVEVGAVGYLSKAAGQFITLFNSLRPNKCDNFTIRNLLPLRLPGPRPIGTQRFDKRTPNQKTYDLIAGSLNLPHAVTSNVSRQCSFRLKKGLTAAYMYTEIMDYHYMNLDSTEVPKTWFSENADTILKVYGYRHQIQKEDLFLVLGEIRTPGYALFVSHRHPEAQARFNVFANCQHGHPWGAFTIEHSTPTWGPNCHVDLDPEPVDFHSKISDVGDPWETILLARLRFRPDSLVPTSQ